MKWACDNGMVRTPFEIAQALTREEFYLIDAFHELEYYESLEKDDQGKPRSEEAVDAAAQADRELIEKRMEKYLSWMEEMNMTPDERQEQKQKAKQEKKKRQEKVSSENNPYASKP